jgi:hypothetical protein
MTATWTCWKCGGALGDIPLPLARLAECPHCRAQLHVCRQCVFYDPAVGQQCREPVAEAVSDKQRANFCGYFQLKPNAHSPSPDQTAASRAGLDALFGDAAPEESEPETRSPAELAREQLEQLFKK